MAKKNTKKNLLTERFCQDPHENWFGRERSLGSTKDNPSITSMASMIVLTDEPLSCWKPKKEWQPKKV